MTPEGDYLRVTEREKEFFVGAWAERLEEELPAEITVERPSSKTVRTRGSGRFAGHSGSEAGFLSLPLPRRLLVQMFFEAELDGLQFQMTYATGAPWPAEGAKRRVRVGGGEVHLEFVDPAGKVVRALRPIPYEPS
jgi:hypothetical protein